MSWLDKLGENIKYAHTVNNLGPAYYVTSQAKEDLREQGKENEAKQIEKAEAIGTVGGAIAGAAITQLPTFLQTMKWLGTPAGRTLLGNIGKDMLVGTAGYLATDEASKAMTGKTVGQQVADGLGKIGLEKIPYSVREGIGNFANPGGWLTWGQGAKFGNWLYNQGENLVSKMANKLQTLRTADGQLWFIRNTRISPDDIPNMFVDGKLKLGQDKNLLVNLTTDVPFRLHKSYSHLPGGEYIFIRPEAFKGRRFLSLEPSDSFLLNDADLLLEPQYVEILTGNKDIIPNLESMGFKVHTTPELQNLHNEVHTQRVTDPLAKIANWETALWKQTQLHRQLVDEYISKNLGRPTLKQYKALEAKTGLKSGVVNNEGQWDQYENLFSEDYIKTLPIEEATVFTFPNGREINVSEILPRGGQSNLDIRHRIPYKYVFYDPVSHVESNLMHEIGLLSKPKNTPENYQLVLKWLDEHGVKPLKSGGSIKIKKKNKGKFTASAKAAGEGVQEHAHKVMNDSNATPLQKKRANFAIQAKKWHRKHQLGGKINYLNIF